MADYIERENAYSAIRSNMFDKMRAFPKRKQRLISLWLDLTRVIRIIPAADVRENVRGEYIMAQTKYKTVAKRKCSACGLYTEVWNFCGNYGADMRGEK